jgi:hypothetical protein
LQHCCYFQWSSCPLSFGSPWLCPTTSRHLHLPPQQFQVIRTIHLAAIHNTHIYFIVLGFFYLLLQTNCRFIGLENVTGFCDPKCKARCAKAGYYQRCYDYCIICCKDCKCVPSGTYGNKSECPCYRDKLNSKGTSKCP